LRLTADATRTERFDISRQDLARKAWGKDVTGQVLSGLPPGIQKEGWVTA
jgi:hypothetical protein